MATNRKINSVSYPAGADLSALQYRVVQMDADGQLSAQVGTATPPLGILLNKPAAAGRAAQVAIVGSIVKCEAGAAVNENDWIHGTVSGFAIAAASAESWVVGIAMTPAAGSGELFEVLVNPQANT